MADPVAIASGILKFLELVAPLAKELFPGIVVAFETGDETEARRLLQEALERHAAEAERIAKSRKAPKRKR